MWKLNFAPVRGCSAVPGDRGCLNCNAAHLTHRQRHRSEYRGYTRVSPVIYPDGVIDERKVRAEWTGRVVINEHSLETVLKKMPEGSGVVWVSPYADLFHEDVPEDFLAEFYKTMLATSEEVSFWITTKRSARLKAFLERIDYPGLVRPNILHGVSICDEVDIPRLVDLASSKAGPRYIEYLALGSLDWRGVLEQGAFGMVVASGETGPHAVGTNPWLLRECRDACRLMTPKVRFVFKGWGEWLPFDQTGDPDSLAVMDMDAYPVEVAYDVDGEVPCNRVGEKIASNWLDGRQHLDGNDEELLLAPDRPRA
jgi:protein gp37